MMKKVILSGVLLLLSSTMFSQSAGDSAIWSGLRNRPYPQWFTDAKLGIFIHWSLSSVPAWSGKEQYAEWFLRGLQTGDSARINFQKRVFGENFTYNDYPPLFKAELFDAKEWAELFRASGARYVVLVSKHHDGYCLWPSKYAPQWNSWETGPHRDIVGELSTAVKASGLKMGLYYSLPEWNNNLFRWGTDQPEKLPLYVNQHMIPQFKELVSTYRPSLLFSDGEWDFPASSWHSAQLISWYYNLMGKDAIVNDRWGSGSEGVGFRTPEYSSGLKNSDRPWVEVRGLGRSFGLNRNETLDAYLSPGDLVHFFVRAVANGGGMILNVGPYCDGQIPLIQQERLKQLGTWLNINGEAIYGSGANERNSEEKPVTLDRTDSCINFDWVRNSPGKPIAEDDFHAEWEGFIQPPFSDTLTFDAVADDEIRVWINGKLIIDRWTEEESQDGTSGKKKEVCVPATLVLEHDKKYPIRVLYREKTQNASVYLNWKSPRLQREPIPASAFYQKSDPGSHGLNASYSSRKDWVCYTLNNHNLYAIMLEWPANNLLELNIKQPPSGTAITMVGRKGALSWKYIRGKLLVVLSSVKISELPCEWAWVFRIQNYR